MGMISAISFYIHYHIPASPDLYYQEIGEPVAMVILLDVCWFIDAEESDHTKVFYYKRQSRQVVFMKLFLSFIREDHRGLRERVC